MAGTLDNNELNALLRLMDDPDEAVYQRIRQRIIDLGTDVVPQLEHAWENTFDDFTRSRLEEIIHTINFQHIKNQLLIWKLNGGEDIIEGALLLSKLRYPSLDLDPLIRDMGTIAQDIWLEMNDKMSPLDKVRVINHIFFDVYEYKGLKTQQLSLSNAFVHQTIQLKRGGPTTLGILYLGLAQSLNLPVYGLDLPMNFSLTWLEADPGYYLAEPEKDPVLFYINPFFKGVVFTRREIDKFIKENNLDSKDHYYHPCSNVAVLLRLAEELRFLMDQENLHSLAEEMREIITILRGNSIQGD
ncbi:MAG: hypothetical protein HPY80_03030 [Bacteroidales bacterium]|jgi:regulator of sirC expression with transglutaminase-like and TPR domain|nr:hypothetical protein [Bacteroidales bacterium]NPV35628.1 hypothetical protein [Bacteroidales bacterium]